MSPNEQLRNLMGRIEKAGIAIALLRELKARGYSIVHVVPRARLLEN